MISSHIKLSSGVVAIQSTRLPATTPQPDITIVLDKDAVITGVTLSNAIAGERFQDWLGRAWVDTVGDVGGDKVRRMVSDAHASGVSAFRQVNQHFPSGLELPIEYTTVRLGEGSGLIAVGKSLQAVSELQTRLIAAQHAMEQDYWKLREVETRYRMLFDASNEAVLLLRAEDLRVVEANPAAIRALGVARGWDFLSEMEAQERPPFQAMLARTRETGKAPGIVIHLGPDRDGWIVRASLMNAESKAVFLLQISSVAAPAAGNDRAEALALATLIDRLPDGFVVLDREGVIRRANRAFLDLVQVGVSDAVIGQNLQRWLAVPGADNTALLASLRKNGAVRLFSTTLRGELGTHVEVELSAAGDAAVSPAFIGISIRDVSRRLSTSAQDQSRQDTSRQSVSFPVASNGNLPLRLVIDEVVGQVERDYVASALEQTGGNRAAAAELLGMSRQSLYAKLNRYGLDVGSKKT